MKLRWIALLLVAAATVGCAVWQPMSPDAIDLAARYAWPSLAHPLGSDNLGRDMLSRLMAGAARTGEVLAIVSAIGFFGGSVVGIAAGVAGGALERLALRAAEMFVVVPTLVIALAATALFGLSPVSAGLALGLAGIGPYALLANALTRQTMAKPFVLAARALGASDARLLYWHVVPDVAPVLLTQVGNNAGLTVVAYASLAFLGLGADTSQPDWGSMLFEYRDSVFDHPMLMVWPGVAIALTAAALNLTFDRDW